MLLNREKNWSKLAVRYPETRLLCFVRISYKDVHVVSFARTVVANNGGGNVP